MKNGERVETELKKAINGVQFLKLHGCINHYLDGDLPLILATEQYVKYRRNRSRLFDRFSDWGHELPILFCGYSINDPNVQNILFDLFDLEIQRPAYFIVSPGITEFDERYWSKHRIMPIMASFKHFIAALDRSISKTVRAIPASMGDGTASIRAHYRFAHPAESVNLIDFLNNDVEYVRKGMPIVGQDARRFYHGYDYGWSSIEQDLDVPRRIVDSILVDAVLAEEEERSSLVDLFVIKGPAGNGKTVVMKRVAWEAAHEFDKLVLYLKLRGAIRNTAIQEIHELTGKRTFLFVDRAAFFHEEIRWLIEFCTERKIPLTIVTAERDNEWNVRCDDLDAFVSKDYPVRFLSEREIEALLKKLEIHKALGNLEAQSFEERVDAFVHRAERQLLVALHETTLGKPFVEIVVDEYRRILPPQAQKLYLDVCSLNRLGVPVRAGLISRISGIRFEDFKKRFFEPLEHVVKVYRDPYLRDYMYTARHQHIAELVFEEVITEPEQIYNQIVRIVQGMNIDYSSDQLAFRQLCRGHVVSETFRSVELGRRFYEVVQNLIGEDYYLLQHKGIFEMRNDSLEKAEQALQKAEALAPHDRSIRHSLANLARRQAQDTQNPLLRSKYRQKARERLSGLVSLQTKKPHDFYTGALVGLDELRDVLSAVGDVEPDKLTERQIVDTAREVEKSIGEGLERFPDNGQLLSLEADYLEMMNEYEQAELALRRAFSANPRQDWIAARLAKRLLSVQKTDEAEEILRKCLSENPNSKRVHFALGKLYLDHGSEKEQKFVADHLRRSFAEGDSNYDAQFWYARHQFLLGNHDEAEKHFSRLQHAPIPANIRNTVRGVVRQSDGSATGFQGIVTKKEATYMFIRCADFETNIFAHISTTSEKEWEHIKINSEVSFTVGFTMRGAIAASVSVGASPVRVT
ncbi:SIR2 family protein [Acidobacteria bacterium AH-259-D05]|nr:SIR2 family protein [Acidobacteria bacterium AH-259-D05]